MRPTGLMAGVVASCVAGAGHAGFVIESELDGQALNNSIASAQLVDGSAFSINASPDIFGQLPTAVVSGQGGGSDVDFYAFFAPAGLAYFDIDSSGFTFDTYLALFDGNGTLLADNDDSFPADPGSFSDVDAFLGAVTLSQAGLYYIAVSAAGNYAKASFSGSDFLELSRPDGAFGGFAFVGADFGNSAFDFNGAQTGADYSLAITVVPAPGAAALVGLAALVRRRRRAA
jgi:hypothetical protein